jgi:uncharacterized membrane protein YeaQ/YmgE (transglycosylase-associated protein family)
VSTTVIGLFVGLLFGLAIAIDGFSGFLLLLVFGAIGVIVAKVIDGELDLSTVLNSRSSRSR